MKINPATGKGTTRSTINRPVKAATGTATPASVGGNSVRGKVDKSVGPRGNGVGRSSR